MSRLAEFGLPDSPTAMRFLPVIPPHIGSEVAQRRLPGRPTSIQLLTQAGGDFVAVDRDTTRREIHDWLQTY